MSSEAVRRAFADDSVKADLFRLLEAEPFPESVIQGHYPALLATWKQVSDAMQVPRQYVMLCEILKQSFLEWRLPSLAFLQLIQQQCKTKGIGKAEAASNKAKQEGRQAGRQAGGGKGDKALGRRTQHPKKGNKNGNKKGNKLGDKGDKAQRRRTQHPTKRNNKGDKLGDKLGDKGDKA
eukprot:s1938_g17.t1